MVDMKQTSRMFAIIAVVGIVIGVYIIISSCAYLEAAPPAADTSYNESIDFSQYPDDVLLLLRCSWISSLLGIDSVVKDSDFCVIGKRVITKTEKVPLAITGYPEIKGIDGTVKVQKVIYGELNTKEIPFYYEEVTGEWRRTPLWVNDPFFMSGPPHTKFPAFICPDDPNQDDEMIIFVQKGKHPLIKELSQSPSILPRYKYIIDKLSGSEYQVRGAFYESTSFISLPAIKLIKEFSALPPEEFEKQVDKLLPSSNNQELLSYIFRENIRNTPGLVEIVETLDRKTSQTAELRFLSYGWALYLLYEFTESNEFSFGWHQGSKSFKIDKINDTQREVLINVAGKQFAEITSVKEGIKYLRLIGIFTYDISNFEQTKFIGSGWKWHMEQWKKFADSPLPIASKLFEKAPALKDNLKKITDSLSQRFKDDPDYPEWAKWVNKIFPAENK
jgi:hypothetical protein